MSIASIELQKAIYTTLSSKYKVYDGMPKDKTMPYITIGAEYLTRDDTKDNKRSKHTVLIHSWSGALGSKEVKEMNAYVIDKLYDASFSILDFKIKNKNLDICTVLTEKNDNETIYHGVVQISYTMGV